MEEILKSHKVLICVGSGGVGKTTVSAALGVMAAQKGMRVLVMTIDPSQRLKVALGIGDGTSGETDVPGQNYLGHLRAAVLNAEIIFREFILGSSTDSMTTQRLLKNRLYQQLSTTLSGSQEFTSLLQLSKIVNKSDYDLIILDTPPAQHALDFLEAPEKIEALFNDSVVRWFVGEDDVGIVRKIISKGTRTVLASLERITGSSFMRELNDFFFSVKAVQHKIEDRTAEVQKILRDEKTGFLLVTGFDGAKLREAEALHAYLGRRGYHLVCALINRAFPEWKVGHERPFSPKLETEYVKWANYHSEREKIFSEFAEKWRKELPVIRIPDLNRDINGLQGLEVISNEMDLSFHRSHTVGV